MENAKESKHLSYFKVENFKNFESFEMNDIGQFNLIVGDNNVGKTNLLEALLFDGDIGRFYHHMLMRACSRNKIKSENFEKFYNTFFFDKSIFSIGSEKKGIRYQLEFTDNESSIRYSIETSFLDLLTKEEVDDLIRKNPDLLITSLSNHKNKEVIRLTQRDSSENVISSIVVSKGIIQDPYHPFIETGLAYEKDLVPFFSEQTDDRNSYKKLVQQLSLMIDSVEELKIFEIGEGVESQIGVYTKGNNNRIPLSAFGDGAIKFLRILLEIQKNQNKRLMIDEVDNGVHFKRFRSYMKAIIQSAKDNKVQLFMTTHSKECIKYFKEALEELGEDYQSKARLISLSKTKTGQVKSYNFDYAGMSGNLEVENEMRD